MRRLARGGKEEQTMSLEANKAVVRRFIEEIWNERKLVVVARNREALTSPCFCVEEEEFTVMRRLQAYTPVLPRMRR